jgi:type IV pilus assembly protein PilW
VRRSAEQMRRRVLRRWLRGVTLVELMVGMTLSLFIAAALGALVANMSRAHAELDRSSRQIENGRYAIELLSEDIKLAGYYADVRQGDVAYEKPDACATAIANLGWSATPGRVPTPIEGFTGDGDVPTCVTDNASHVDETALLAVHRLSTQTTPAASVSGGAAHVQTSQCASDPFMPSLVISSNPADFTLQNLACTATNPVRRYLSRIYYVAPCSDCDRDTIPTLKRLELSGAAWQETALAEGIEEIQFEYGFDTNGDSVPDEFRTALDGIADSPTNDWSNVMAVRVWVVSRATEVTRGYTDTKTYQLGAHGARGPFNDGFKRRVYTTVVRLQNPAGWRES